MGQHGWQRSRDRRENHLTARTLRLPDGRNLGYQVFGADDAPAAIYCHGWPSSRLEAGLIKGLPVRLIAADRPGYGLSDPSPGPVTLHDLAMDIAVLADHLQLPRFAVVGVSGGGPLACACARYLADRVSALTLISAVPPPEEVKGGPLGLLMWFGRRPPWLGRPAIWLVHRLTSSKRWAERVVFSGLRPGRDATVLTPTVRAGLLAAMREGLQQGGAGALTDAGLYGQSWGFKLQEITVSTTIWHGTADHLVAESAAEAYRAIPNSSVRVLSDEGHYSLGLGQTRMIMDDLVARASGAVRNTGIVRNPA